MKIKQSKEQQSTILNGSCHRLSPKILLRKHFGGPPIGATRSYLSLSLSLFAISIVICSFLLLDNNTSALTYSNHTDVLFTFEPSINVSLSSSDLVIEDLVPGSYADSNIITINVSTNNIYGYNLTATAGNGSTFTSTDLIHHNNTDNDNTNNLTNTSFTSLATNASIASMGNASPNEWGYSASSDNGTSWSNYSGLPYYSNPGAVLALSSTNGESSIKFKIGVNADNTQIAGEYNNVINFVAVTNAIPSAPGNCLSTATCMQTMTECPTTPTTVTDARDGSTYKVQRLADGNCWMLDNLALDLTNSDVQTNMLSTVDTMTNATYEQLNYLFNGGGTTTDQYPTAKLNNEPWTSSDQDYYSVPMIVTDYKDALVTSYGPASANGKAEIGIYYNYCAASAGTYCYGNGTDYTDSPTTDPNPNSLYDIDGDVCPAGWRMPTSSDNGEYRTLCSAIKGSECAAGVSIGTAMDIASSSSVQYQFSMPLSGIFESGVVYGHGSYGYFWSSTWFSISTEIPACAYSKVMYPSVPYGRRTGISMRCLMSS